MKKLLIIFTLIPLFSFAQENIFKPEVSKDLPFRFIEGGVMNIEGSPSSMYSKENSEIKGTKYFDEEWKEGYLILNDSLSVFQDKINYDFEEGNVILKSKSLGIYKAEDNRITGFVIIDYDKRRYFKKLSKNDFEKPSSLTNFYEVVITPTKTNYLIKQTKKFIFRPTQASFHNAKKEYKERIKYFIKNSNNKYVKVELTKKSILKALKDKKEQIVIYANKNKTNFHRERDVVRLLDYYHTL